MALHELRFVMKIIQRAAGSEILGHLLASQFGLIRHKLDVSKRRRTKRQKSLATTLSILHLVSHCIQGYSHAERKSLGQIHKVEVVISKVTGTMTAPNGVSHVGRERERHTCFESKSRQIQVPTNLERNLVEGGRSPGRKTGFNDRGSKSIYKKEGRGVRVREWGLTSGRKRGLGKCAIGHP